MQYFVDDFYTKDSAEETIAREEFRAKAKLLRDLFSSDNGKTVFDFLKKLYCDSFFDANHPTERALYQQGQVRVIKDIQDIIDSVNKGLL